MKNWKHDILLAAGLLLAAAVLFIFLRPGEAGGVAVVTVDGKEWGRYPLSTDAVITIGQEDYNVLEIKNGEAAIIEANCGNLQCVRTGPISRVGQLIVCLPHRLTVEICGGSDTGFDALSQ